MPEPRHDREVRTVVVGVDGSRHSIAALRWAAAEALARRSELVVATVDSASRSLPVAQQPADLSGGGTGQQSGVGVVLSAYERCTQMQAQLLAELPQQPPRLSTHVLHGDPVDQLTKLAGAQDILVLGAAGRGRLGSFVLGSLAFECAQSALGPVVVVRANALAGDADASGGAATAARGGPAPGPVIAAVDGSAASRRALQFAAEESRAHQVPLVAVHVLYPDYVLQHDGGSMNGDMLDPVESAWAQLQAIVRAEASAPTPPAHAVVVTGDPAAELIGRSATASLMVVGLERMGPRLGTLLGSVSMRLLRQAECPVAVVSESWRNG